MDSKMTLEDKLKVIQSFKSDGSKAVHLKDELFAFVYSDNKMSLLSVTDDIKSIDDKYNLKYIGEHIIILNKLYNAFQTESLIIDRKTFDIIHKYNRLIDVCDKLVYVQNSFSLFDAGDIKRDIFDLKGNKLLSVDGGTDFSIVTTDNPEYYIAIYKSIAVDLNATNKESYIIIKYNEKDNTLKEVWNSDKYDIETVGDGLLMFSSRDDYRNIFIYDIINKRTL